MFEAWLESILVVSDIVMTYNYESWVINFFLEQRVYIRTNNGRYGLSEKFLSGFVDQIISGLSSFSQFMGCPKILGCPYIRILYLLALNTPVDFI